MTKREQLLANIGQVQANLRMASERFGQQVTLCGVTKTVDVETINLSYDCGIRVIGENRVQEAMQKFPALNPEFQLHIIGQLQTNKVKYILSAVKMVQSLDRIELAQEIDRRAQMHHTLMPVLIQVNIANEPQKAGVDEADLIPLIKSCAQLPGLSVEGLMAIMPMTDDPEQVRPYFARMRRLYDHLTELAISGVQMKHLSMGMSGDYIVAAQEGATMVRVGSSIYGFR